MPRRLAQLGQRHVVVVLEPAVAGGRHPARVGPAQGAVVQPLFEQIHETGEGLDNPEVALAADPGVHRPRFLEQLVRGFVIEGARLLIFAGKKVSRMILVEIDAQRHVDLRLPLA